jgi:hypothetical protein
MDVGETLEEGSAVNQTSSESTASSCQQWVSTTISNFSKLYAMQKQKQQQSQQSMMNKIAIPRMKDRATWHIFCLGKEEAMAMWGDIMKMMVMMFVGVTVLAITNS